MPQASDLVGSYGTPYGTTNAAGSASGPGYGQASAFSSIKQAPPHVNTSNNQTSKVSSQGSNFNQSRVPPPSKIPNSAVEMPGDSLARLDVQFGGLDLQFGGGSSAASDSVSSFEFNGNAGQGPAVVVNPSQSSVAQNATNVVEQDKYSLSGGAGSSDKGQTGISSVTASAVASSSASGPMDGPYGHPPSAKEVSKSLSNAMSGGKLVGPTAANDVGGYDPRKSGSGYSSRPVPPPGAGGMVDMKNDALVYHNPQQNSFNSSYNKQQQSSYGVQQQYSSQNQYGGGPNQSGSYGSSGIVQ